MKIPTNREYATPAAPASVGVKKPNKIPPTTIIADVYTVTEKNIGMYPNPTEGVVTMQLGENQSDVILYNAMGQVLKEYRSVSGSFNIDLSEYNSGMYFLNIKNDTFNATKKIVKK